MALARRSVVWWGRPAVGSAESPPSASQISNLFTSARKMVRLAHANINPTPPRYFYFLFMFFVCHSKPPHNEHNHRSKQIYVVWVNYVTLIKCRLAFAWCHLRARRQCCHLAYFIDIITFMFLPFLNRVSSVECGSLYTFSPGIRISTVHPAPTGLLHTASPTSFRQLSRDQLYDLHPCADDTWTKHSRLFRDDETDYDSNICLDTPCWWVI